MITKTLEEIRQIPQAAAACLEKNRNLILPPDAVYLGMGASYNALMAVRFAVPITVELASDYYYYLSEHNRKLPLGVLVSQSGKSFETVLCREVFDKYIAVVNDLQSPLATGKNAKQTVLLHAGEETSISTKTYVNTLICLFLGVGIDPEKAVVELERDIDKYEKWGRENAEKIYSFISRPQWKGFYIIGNGPNRASAIEAALTTGELTKLGIIGMSIYEYDHGPKETAQDTVVVAIDVSGKASKRMNQVLSKIETVKRCLIIKTPKIELDENISPIAAIVSLNFLNFYLAKLLGVKNVYNIGKKVTEE